MLEKLRQIKEHFDELSRRIADPELIARQDEWRRAVKEHAQLEEVVQAYEAYLGARAAAEEAEQLMDSDDAEMREMARMEYEEGREQLAEIEQRLRVLLLPRDPDDDKDVILEIRAGTGGEEAALFGADLMRMYLRYAERHRLKSEIMNLNETGLGGVKEAIIALGGDNVYGKLKYESGAHRVQRVPETESQGRIQTSAATVVVMPETDDVEIDINPADLKIDTYRAGGAGGQHVNKTESAIRITHLPTGIVVQCMDERSQHKNKDKAMRTLKARLYDYFQSQQHARQSAQRKSLVGSGDRSERIRTYNFPQSRMTDHRIGFTSYKLGEVMDGDLDELIEALGVAERAAQLSELGTQI